LAAVFVDKSGNMQLKQCHLQHDIDLASFLALMDKYPQEFDLNVTWAASFWDGKIQDLKGKGYDGHPKLVEIEQLIAAHKSRDYEAVPKWMFYKTNQQVAYAKPIENEHDLKKILEIVSNPTKNNRLACMVRVCRVRLILVSSLKGYRALLTCFHSQAVDKDLILISDELKFFEAKLGDSVAPSDPTVSPHAQGDRSDQQPNDKRAPGIDSFTADNCSFDSLARPLGVGFNFAFLRCGDDDEEEEEEEDKQLPWSSMKNIDKS
jgi:hypothetical protein